MKPRFALFVATLSMVIHTWAQAPDGTPTVWVGGAMVTGASVTHRGPAEVVLATTYPGGRIVYTLDGSEPTPASKAYAAPFRVVQSVVLRATAYTADRQQRSAREPVEVTILPTLTPFSAGGGAVAVDPPGGAYAPGGRVTATAIPQAGWRFLYWLGDADGDQPTVTLVMDRDRCVEAVFGTALGTVVDGAGEIRREPDCPWYPWGTVVRLAAVPAEGRTFSGWGSAAEGTENPITFQVVTAEPRVEAHFGGLEFGRHALVVVEEGGGAVRVEPRANEYAVGAQVTLTPVPGAGQLFTGWDDTANVQSPLVVTIERSQTVVAHFTRRPALRVAASGGLGSPAGFRLQVQGSVGAKYRIERSTDLVTWETADTLAAPYGVVQFNDPHPLTGPGQAYRAMPVPADSAANPNPAALIWVSPGSVLMGSPPTESGRLEDEGPRTQVTLTKGFWLAKYELTQREWVEVMGFNLAAFQGDPERPIEQVSWYDAMEYCDRLNQREQAAGRLPAGYRYGLPTEAQREYACRAGTTTAYNFGSNSYSGLLPAYAWHWDNSGSRPGVDLITHPVGQKAPSPWGFYDILGNVWEWCADWHGPYPGGSQVDWPGVESGVHRIARGGSAWHSGNECRSAARHHHAIDNRSAHVGFRVALLPVP